ncbi:MAG: deoxyribonuclease IV [Patescibacteria group bacterium]|nr:deoxyribonuclease IV [Patescibacteria group bacterium]
MKFGAHVSIAGGVQNAPLNAEKIGCETFQMFTRSPQGGPAPKLTNETLEEFGVNCAENGLVDWVVHAPYYINFASVEKRIRDSSARIIREDLERASLLKARYLMFHPGSAKGTDFKTGMRWCVEGIKTLLDGYAGSTELLIEISAGAGEIIGDTFEEIAELLQGVGHTGLGACFDTAHAFASGYDLRDKKAVRHTFDQFDEIIGLNRLKAVHCNDSKIELGAHKDRHEHLGKGFIGIGGFKAIIKEKRLGNTNLYLETEPEGVEHDLEILKGLRDNG